MRNGKDVNPIELEPLNTIISNDGVTPNDDNEVDNESKIVDPDNYVIEPRFPYDFDFDDSDNSECTEGTTDKNELNNIFEEKNTNDNNRGIEIEYSTNLFPNCNSENKIPCSSSGAGGGLYLSEECKSNFIGCHVILNNCGSLLARRGFKLKGTKVQQRFCTIYSSNKLWEIRSIIISRSIIIPKYIL